MSGFTSDLGASFSPDEQLTSQYSQLMNRVSEHDSGEVQEAEQWADRVKGMRNKVREIQTRNIPSGLKQTALELERLLNEELQRTQAWLNNNQVTQPGYGG